MKEERFDTVTLKYSDKTPSCEELLIIFIILKNLFKNSAGLFGSQLIAIFCQLGDI